MICSHKKKYYFHDNAPAYCPTCDCYVNSMGIIGEKSEKYIILERRAKMKNIYTKIKNNLTCEFLT